MEQRSSPRNAAVKDARIKPSDKECVSNTGQRRRNYVAVKDALTTLKMEECALGMEQR